MVMQRCPLTWRAGRAVATSRNSSAASICAQWPQCGNTCSDAFGISLERHERAVERVDAVLAPPGEQHVVAQPVGLAPEHAVLGGVGVPERHPHRGHRGLGAGGGGVGEALLDQLVGDQRLVDHHRGDEPRSASRLGSPAKSISRCTPSVGSAWNRFEREAARPHQHQPADPVGVAEREPHRRAPAQAVAEQVHALDAELVEQERHR